MSQIMRLNAYFEDIGLTIYCAKAEEVISRLQESFGSVVMDCPYRFGPDSLAMFPPEMIRGAKIITFSPLDVTVPAFGHPHARPIAEMVRLLEGTEGTILDPYMGVGSTLIAAKLLNRRVVGIEMCEKYCQTAVERWKAA